METKPPSPNTLGRDLILRHFGDLRPENLVTASRVFSITARADLQLAIDRMLASVQPVGMHAPYGHETLTLATIMRAGDHPVVVSPLQFDEIDIGAARPMRCIDRALWLDKRDGMPFAVLLSPATNYGRQQGFRLEIAVGPGESGARFSGDFLNELQKEVFGAGTYRGKIISLDTSRDHFGQGGEVKVHRLAPISRDALILSEKTLRLLERNVLEFIAARERMQAMGMSVRKGLLFYGPPGTGKTHTIRYLAGLLPGHTTLLITAEQVGNIGQYFQLARYLQPALVVIEDVDLIARAREQMRGTCEESLLNKLLNEMDGLNEDAAIVFVLTTNRPEQLEAALAARPGRVDQAIEFPSPDDDGRRRLIRLYSGGLSMSDSVVAEFARRTDGASAAFIKELLRRAAQEMLRTGGDKNLESAHLQSALDDMVISGGRVNLNLLGAAATA